MFVTGTRALLLTGCPETRGVKAYKVLDVLARVGVQKRVLLRVPLNTE